ncbi:MAG TPA: imelysin family protein [Polyangiaceae bacterium]|nr:imelysin family protein [Polyangiaceae bacterium]
MAASLLFAASIGCQSKPSRRELPEDRAFELAIMRRYADIAFEGYSDAAEAARRLRTAVENLLDQPSPARLAAARVAWLDARVPYLQTEVFRFYDGPIDRVEGFVNTWPIDENYVDSAGSASSLGIVENAAAYPNLSASLLLSLNEREGETNVSTGFHVIEYLLWGQDQRDDGPGDRSYQDYVVVQPADSPSAEGHAARTFAKRRAKYLELTSELLTQHLAQVSAAWAPEKDNYRAKFLALPPREALALMIKGLGTLSGPELSGERLTVPYETKDQGNEHSCFSDSTQSDIVYDALGVENTCLGRHRRLDGSETSGAGLCELLARRNVGMAAQLKSQLAVSVAAARSIPTPFDRAILGSDSAPGRSAILRTIKALQAQAETFAAAAAPLGVTLSLGEAKRP